MSKEKKHRLNQLYRRIAWYHTQPFPKMGPHRRLLPALDTRQDVAPGIRQNGGFWVAALTCLGRLFQRRRQAR